MFGERSGAKSSIRLPLFSAHSVAVVDDALDDNVGLFSVAFDALEHLVHATVEAAHAVLFADRVTCVLVTHYALVAAADRSEAQYRQTVLAAL